MSLKSILPAGLLILGGLFAPALADDAEELDALGKTFALGFWEKSPEQVLSTVHPALSKKGRDDNWRGTGQEMMEHLSPARLQILGRIYNHDDRLQKVDGPRVIVHEITGNAASIEMVNGEWYDFFTAVKIDGEWSLLNCVYGGLDTYQSQSADEDSAAIDSVLTSYIAGLAGDKDRLEETLHIELERRQLGTTQGGATYIEPLAREALILDAGSFGIEEDEARFTVHNFTARVASARVDAGPWSEQVQLMKLNGNWQIVNSFVL